MLKTFLKDESGATAIEYGLIAAIVGIGIITVLQLVRTELQNVFNAIASALADRG